MKMVLKILNRVFDALLALLMLGIVVTCMAEIIARNLFSTSFAWSGEAGRYLFVYVVFIGAFILARDREFICMDLLKAKVPAKHQFVYNLILDVMLIFFAAVLVYSGYQFTIANRLQISSAMGIPKPVIYIITSISGVFIILYTVINVYGDIKKKTGKGGAE